MLEAYYNCCERDRGRRVTVQNRSAARGCLRSSSRFDDFECYGRSRAPSRLLLEIDVGKRLPVLVADGEAGVSFSAVQSGGKRRLKTVSSGGIEYIIPVSKGR